MAAVAHHDLGARAVVGSEKDERILVYAHRLELGDQPTDILVHAVDHGGVDRHLRRLEAALLGGQFGPRQGTGDFARAQLLDRSGEGIRRPHLALEGRQRRLGQAHLLLAGEAGGAHGLPAVEVLVSVFGDVLGKRVQGEVRGDVGDVLEERLVFVVGGVVLQAIERVGRRGRRRVVVLLVGGDFDRDIVDRIAAGGEEVPLVLHVQRTVKAGGDDLPVDVPLAAVVVAVARGTEELRE